MSRNGSGTYTLPAGNPVVSGTTISSTWANTTLSDIAASLTGSVASDGQTPMSGNLNMASNKINNVTDPTLAQDAATKAYVDASIPSTDAFLVKTNNLSDVANATTARENLSAAKSGANSDITSITGLTTALTVAQGGTGSTTLTANNVLLGNGTSAIQAVAPGTSGNVLTSNGTTWTSVASSSSYIGQNSQLFTSSGTFTVPTGVTAVKVVVVGGGGGGAAGAASAGNGAGGGAGGACMGWFTGLTSGGTISVTVGAAGTGGTGAGGAGGSGGQTIFSTFTANGGSGGTFGGSGGSGGTSTSGTFYANGATGGPSGNSYGGSGTIYPTLSAVNWSVGGAFVVSSFGSDGVWYGGGGAGGDGTGIGYNPAGGAGKAGMVLVEW